jgi:hypothetical protein
LHKKTIVNALSAKGVLSLRLRHRLGFDRNGLIGGRRPTANLRSKGLRPWSFFANSYILMIPLPRDFQEFLRLLNDQKIEHLIVGGYAVGHYGYVRYTGDLDIFVALSEENAEKLTRAFRAFGFDLPEVKPGLLLNKGRIVRIGHEPMRLEILTAFTICLSHRNQAMSNLERSVACSKADLRPVLSRINATGS